MSLTHASTRWRSTVCRCCGATVSEATQPGRTPTLFDTQGGPHHQCVRDTRECPVCLDFLYTRHPGGAVLQVADDLPHVCGQPRQGIVVQLAVRVQPERVAARDVSSLVRREPEGGFDIPEVA